jgi:polyisoprenoid-binding protein YceI
MKRMICIASLMALVVQGASGRQHNYSIQPNDASRLELRVFKTGLYRGKAHRFLFPDYTGTLVYHVQAPEASHIELTLDAGSIKCLDTWLSAKELKTVQEFARNEMLAAGRYPKVLFVSSAIRRIAESRFEVRGTLTIRGIAKPATVDVTFQESDEVLMFRGTARVLLTDYGLKPPTALLGAIGTKNEMEFSFSLKLRPRLVSWKAVGNISPAPGLYKSAFRFSDDYSKGEHP